MSKLKTREEVKSQIEAWQAEGKKVAYTSGVFDIVHPGHVDSLEKAKALADVLVVAVNSDSSVKTYKDPERPIVTQGARAAVVAAMEVVDVVFIFDETNNNKNIEVLKPDVYIKAGDYKKSDLSSTPIVEGYGGTVEVVPFLEGYSSTSVIDKIKMLAITALPEQEAKGEPKPAVFLDRDGTLIKLVDHLHEPSKVELLPGVVEGLKQLREAGYKLVVVTNQAGIGMGHFTVEDYFAVTRKMLGEISKGGALLDRIYFSPHTELDKTDYRKPGAGMLKRAVDELNIDLTNSVIIGDSKADVEAGKAAGCKTILVLSGGTDKDKAKSIGADVTADNFSKAIESIIS